MKGEQVKVKEHMKSRRNRKRNKKENTEGDGDTVEE